MFGRGVTPAEALKVFVEAFAALARATQMGRTATRDDFMIMLEASSQAGIAAGQTTRNHIRG